MGIVDGDLLQLVFVELCYCSRSWQAGGWGSDGDAHVSAECLHHLMHGINGYGLW